MQTLQQVFEDASIAVNVMDEDRTIRWYNKVYQVLMDADDDHIGRKCWEIFHPEDPSCEKCESRGAVVRYTRIKGRDRCLLTHTNRYKPDLLYKIVEDLNNVLKSFDLLVEQIKTMRQQVDKLRLAKDIIVLCCECDRMRLADGTWLQRAHYDFGDYQNGFSHGYCPECAKKFCDSL